jgi:TfuA protein
MAMTLTVYAGSSLYEEDVARLLSKAAEADVSLVFKPPIIRGDLLAIQAAEGWNWRALILDGRFGQDLAVSVTEVREYLSMGLYLAGASSMGALRAVECRILGMVRHGWVAEQYLSGHIDSDAEVALLMDPVTSMALTIPLVNIRWLLQELEREGTLNPQESEDILHVAQRIHYRARTPDMLSDALQRTLTDSRWQLLTGFLKSEEMPSWDRKRLDGISAVESEIRSMTLLHGSAR